MTAKIELKTASGGKVILDPQDTAVDRTLVLPATTANLLAGSGFTLSASAPANTFVTDASGNVGIGVTPSAWGRVALQRGSSAFFEYGTNNTILSSNYYFDGTTNRYLNNGYATYYQQFNGTHTWNLAPSGTAGNAISFTQAMTLDASGNLLVGTTSALLSATGRGNITLNGSSDSILSFGAANVLSAYIYSSAANLELDAQGSRHIQFNTNGAERARIDSSGNLLVGRTTNAGGNWSHNIQSTGGSGAWPLGIISTDRGLIVRQTANTSGFMAYFEVNNGTTIGSISNTTTAVAYNTSSDYRLKEQIAPMTGALAKNELLNPVTYKWKSDGSDGQGFIAHELQAVFPDAVTGEKDAVDDEGNPVYQGVDTSFLVGHLVACVKELTAELNNVKAELAAMKGSA